MQIIYPSRAIPHKPLGPSPSFHSLLQHLTWRPTRPADQLVHRASARRPSPPLDMHVTIDAYTSLCF